MAATLCMSSNLCILDKNRHCQAITVRSAITRSNRVPSPGAKRAPLSSSLLGLRVSVQSPGPPPTKVTSQRAMAARGSSKQEVLDAVNELRARHQAPPVSWDNTVAQYAKDYSNQLIANGQFEHSGGPYGENLFGGTGSNWTVLDAINSWYSEVNQYDFNNPGFTMQTGHFTALVWRSTTSIGVGVAKGNGRTVITMNFDPPGNYEGEFGSNVLP